MRGQAVKTQRRYRVKQVADLTGLTIRTLHHYDNMRLLVPSARTSKGYRLYTDEDLLRLQQILIGRELGLSLEAIRRLLDDPSFDRRRALLEQRKQLEQRAAHAQAMLRSIDAAIAALEANQSPLSDTASSRSLDMTDMKELFDGFDPSQYEEEARQRFGHTDAYRESNRRAKNYGLAEWEAIKTEQDEIYKAAAKLLVAGERPDSAAAMDVAERHRLSIERWFYPCSYTMHQGLADMYEADARFAQNIDKYGDGLTPYLSAAFRANAARGETPSGA